MKWSWMKSNKWNCQSYISVHVWEAYLKHWKTLGSKMQSGTRMDFKDIILEGWWSFTWMMWFQLSVYRIADGSMGLEYSLQSTCKWISAHLSYVIKALNCWHKEDSRSEAVSHEAPSPKTKGSKQPLHLKEEAVKCQVKLGEAVGYVGQAEYVYRHMLQWNELRNIGL